jgi:hypothetical protein
LRWQLNLSFTTTLVTPGARVTVEDYRNLVLDVG